MNTKRPGTKTRLRRTTTRRATPKTARAPLPASNPHPAAAPSARSLQHPTAQQILLSPEAQGRQALALRLAADPVVDVATARERLAHAPVQDGVFGRACPPSAEARRLADQVVAAARLCGAVR